MDSELDIIIKILKVSISNMFAEQPDILDSTSQTKMTEWNLSHRYSNYISNFLYWFDTDNDVIKVDHKNKRPDIIFHKRKLNDFNYLVVEMKKIEGIDENDKKKIKEDWEKGELQYKFGACVSIKEDKSYSIWVNDMEKGEEKTFSNKYQDERADILPIDNSFKSEMREYMERKDTDSFYKKQTEKFAEYSRYIDK